jgi:hypothetical protein
MMALVTNAQFITPKYLSAKGFSTFFYQGLYPIESLLNPNVILSNLVTMMASPVMKSAP